MVTYPVFLRVEPYSGRNERLKEKLQERIQAAKRISDYMNKRLNETKDDHCSFAYGFIANDLHIDIKMVIEILTFNGGGDNGIMIYKSHSI